MSAFTVFSSDCILLNNLIDGLGVGHGGWGGGSRAGPNLTSSWMGRPLEPPAKGSPGRWVGRQGWGERTDRRQDQSYVQVRPTFHQSKTIHSIFMQKFEVECTFQKPSLASWREAHRRGSWKSSEPGGPPSWMRLPLGVGLGRGGLPQRCPVSCFVR